MPKVGLSVAEQTSGGSQFTIPNGRYEVIESKIGNHTIPGYPTGCGYLLTVQPLDTNWNPTGDDTITEFLGCGPVTKFHPGLADGPDDASPELEIDCAKDAGVDDGVEGTQLLSVSGSGPDKKSKSVRFMNSLILAGAPASMQTGYAPALVGLKCTLTQMPTEKGVDYKGKNDPTALIVGVNGKEAGAVVFAWPGGAPVAAAAAPAAAKRTPAAPKPTAIAASVSAPAAPTAPAAGAPVVEGEVTEELDSKGTDILVKLGISNAGTTITRQKIASKLVTIYAKDRVPTTMHKPITALMASEWFVEKAKDLGWTVDGVNVTFPAAA